MDEESRKIRTYELSNYPGKRDWRIRLLPPSLVAEAGGRPRADSDSRIIARNFISSIPWKNCTARQMGPAFCSVNPFLGSNVDCLLAGKYVMNAEGLGLAWLGLGIALVLLGVLAWRWARGQLLNTGLPPGEVIFSDHGTWFRQREALFSENLGLTGKPDYLVEGADGTIIPVEIKSSLAPQEPHAGHVMQLAAYCLLVDEIYGERPLYGILQYRDRAFAIDYTIEIEEDLLDLLASMREDLFTSDVVRNHDEWSRCAGCSVRDHCSQRMA